MAMKSIGERMAEIQMTFDQLVQATGIDKKVMEAIYYGRWTPSPQQRQRVADALGADVDQIGWGHSNEVIHIYGHGPQFGRSP